MPRTGSDQSDDENFVNLSQSWRFSTNDRDPTFQACQALQETLPMQNMTTTTTLDDPVNRRYHCEM